MRQLTAVVTVVLLTCLGLASVGSAQAQQPLQIQGTLQAANCQAQEITVNTSGGASTFPVTDQTAIYVNGTLTPVCSLQSFVGAPVTVYLVPSNSQFVLGRLDVNAPQAASQPAPSSVAAPSSASTAVGIALGALFLGGLAYVLLHNANNQPAPAPAYDYNRGGNHGPDQHNRCPDRNNGNQWCR
jgi:hypothetical protein